MHWRHHRQRPAATASRENQYAGRPSLTSLTMRIHLLLLLLTAPAAIAQTATYAVFQQLAPTIQPPDRDSAQMAFDEARGRVLLAGGKAPGGGATRQDTWEWDGTNWQQVVPPFQLNFARNVRLVYSPQRAQVLAVTGEDTWNGPPMKIYGWTGSNWVLVDGNGPVSRAGFFEVTWDSQRGVLVMFGAPFTAETWEWDGLGWQQRGTGGPAIRSGHRLVYDEARQRVVLFGGTASSNQQLADTWEWNGSYWFEHFGITQPPTSMFTAMAYDRARQRVVLHGGYQNSNDTGGVYEFDGTAWMTRTTSGGPYSMWNASMAYLPTEDHMLVFGGNQGSTWQRTRTITAVTGYLAETVTHQSGCAGPVGVPTLAALAGSRPVLGEMFQMRFSNLPNSPFSLVLATIGYSDQTWGVAALPLDLTPFGFTGCLLHTEPSGTQPLSNLGGMADWNIAVPTTPSLDGLTFFLQGLALTPGFNPGGAVTTSSLRCRAGIL